MSISVKTLPEFDKQLKKLVKKYPSLKSEFHDLIDNLEKNPHLGAPLFKNCYKIRIAIKSKSKGKSGGGRVITHVALSENSVYLLSIYDKSGQESVTDSFITSLLSKIKPE
ncbi:type II toxin-antitoxin system RelE/ParE family toxin [Litoribacter ruber]|uniref:Type II toxin-antitoxin system RelE/ParE family toxin n=1 Tax=Litoribacter ruber TaxID=702568 RepID=A0AAP2G0Z5_9BACT|nr:MULTISPECIES: type II toxin-antitoxin system RelE/ParE family toxin [Litoribacter]MBS9523744.1 type II toxin-antitoxin system RelE/ParE family toxin [Litoribacter alkaliphilus]MBT0812259.1 type II toxin-antitoxin system RelE/ParE family toxin [Litoribacter ruber]